MLTFESYDRSSTRFILLLALAIFVTITSFFGFGVRADGGDAEGVLLARYGGIGATVFFILVAISVNRAALWKVFLPGHNFHGVWIAKDTVRSARDFRFEQDARAENGTHSGPAARGSGPETPAGPAGWSVVGGPDRAGGGGAADDSHGVDKTPRPDSGDIVYHIVNAHQTLYSISLAGTTYVTRSRWHRVVDEATTKTGHAGVKHGGTFYSSRFGRWVHRRKQKERDAGIFTSESGASQKKYSNKRVRNLERPPAEDEWWTTSCYISEYAKHLIASYQVARPDNHSRQASTRGTMNITVHVAGNQFPAAAEWMTGRYYGFDGEHRAIFGSMEFRRISGVDPFSRDFPKHRPLRFIAMSWVVPRSWFASRVRVCRRVKNKVCDCRLPCALPNHLRTEAEARRRFQMISRSGSMCGLALRYIFSNPEDFWLRDTDTMVRRVEEYVDRYLDRGVVDSDVPEEEPDGERESSI